MKDLFDLVDVVEISKQRCLYPIEAKLKYATTKNFVGTVIQGYERGLTNTALLGKETAEKLCEVQKYLNEHYSYSLLIYDAYRPKRAVNHFLIWSREKMQTPDELKRKEKHCPDIRKDELFERGYVAEDSGHCYGNTVDLVLKDVKKNAKLNMGVRFDFMGELSHITKTEEEIGKEAVRYRQILSEAMKKFGFEPYKEEYWHFSYKGKLGRNPQGPLDIPITSELIESLRKLSH